VTQELKSRVFTYLVQAVAFIATMIVIAQNIVVPMVHKATIAETTAISAKVGLDSERITALETSMGDIKGSLSRIETVALPRIEGKIDQHMQASAAPRKGA